MLNGLHKEILKGETMNLDEALRRTDEDEELVAINRQDYSYGYTRYNVWNINSDGTASIRYSVEKPPLDWRSFKIQYSWSLVRIRDGRWESVVDKYEKIDPEVARLRHNIR
jgi:hypothetical protein